MDLWTAVILFPIYMEWIPPHIIFIHSAYLFIKGMVFWGDFYSVLDIIIAFYLIIIIIGFNSIIITILASIYLLQKAAFSLKQ